MKFILEEHKYTLNLVEKYILLEKNRRTEARPLEQGQKLLQTYLSKYICRVFGHGSNYKVVNPEAAGVPTLEDKDLKPDLKHLLNSGKDGWLKADDNNLEYWAELTAKRLKAENKLIVDDKAKTITIKTDDEPEEKWYTITFSDGVAQQKVKEGEKVARPVDPKKDGFTFVDWFKEEEKYDFDTAVNSDLTLTAKWEEETKETDTTDWGERYRSSKNKTAFWDVYFKKVWNKSDQLYNKVLEISEAFKQELEAFGFKKEINPMIEFVEKYWQRFTHDNYVAIHDGLAKNYINKKDVKGLGKLKNSNIIFSKDLYTKSYEKIVEYLELQKGLINVEISKLKSDDTDGSNILSAAGDSIEKLNFLVMFDVAHTTSTIDLENSKLDTHDSIEVKLQQIGATDFVQNSLLGKFSADSGAIANKLNSNIHNINDAKIAIAALITKFASKSSKTKIYSLFKDSSIISDHSIAELLKLEDNAAKFFAFNTLLADISTLELSKLFEIIKSICRKAGIELKAE